MNETETLRWHVAGLNAASEADIEIGKKLGHHAA